MNKWLGASFLGPLHPPGAQNKTLISNTDSVRMLWKYALGKFAKLFWLSRRLSVIEFPHVLCVLLGLSETGDQVWVFAALSTC